MFPNCVLLTSFKNGTYKTQVDNVWGIEIMIKIYKLLE